MSNQDKERRDQSRPGEGGESPNSEQHPSIDSAKAVSAYDPADEHRLASVRATENIKTVQAVLSHHRQQQLQIQSVRAVPATGSADATHIEAVQATATWPFNYGRRQ